MEAMAQTAVSKALDKLRPAHEAIMALIVTGGCFACFDEGGTNFSKPRQT